MIQRLHIGLEIARCVRRGDRSFAEHVIGVSRASSCGLASTFCGILDACAKDEMAAENADSLSHGAEHDPVAQAGQ